MEKEVVTGGTPLISVIVPVYKVEPYLHRCVDSILNQTYKNLEIILVDDGSPDRCGEICDEYAAKDSRIRVIHLKNSGVSVARNAGLDRCTGDYIAFVDSDDYIDPDMIQRLLLEIGTADFCGCGFIHETPNGNVLSLTKPVETICEKGLKFLRQHYDGRNGAAGIALVSVWAKLYRSERFKHLRFRQGIYFEDICLMPYLLMQCTEGRFIPYAGYHYLVNGDSITNKKDDTHAKKCYEDCFEVWKEHEAFYHEQGLKDLEMEVQCLKVEKIMSHVLNGEIPHGCARWSKKMLRRTVMELLFKPIGKARKLRYMVFSVLGLKGYRVLHKIVK